MTPCLCPKCGEKHHVPDELAGLPITCKGCGEPFLAPGEPLSKESSGELRREEAEELRQREALRRQDEKAKKERERTQEKAAASYERLIREERERDGAQREKERREAAATHEQIADLIRIAEESRNRLTDIRIILAVWLLLALIGGCFVCTSLTGTLPSL